MLVLDWNGIARSIKAKVNRRTQLCVISSPAHSQFIIQDKVTSFNQAISSPKQQNNYGKNQF